jgi:HlyD family secretion protein
MVDNVVNYTVVVQVENPKHELLPGMTARVDFLVKVSTGVLKVSNAALRYKPSEELLAQIGSSPTPGGSPRTPRRPSTGADPSAPGSPRRDARNGASSGRSSSGTLYVLDASGRLESVRVQTGLTDGSFTEIQGRNVSEGMKVIAGLAPTTTAASKPASNPLSPTPQNRRGPPGGGGPF